MKTGRIFAAFFPGRFALVAPAIATDEKVRTEPWGPSWAPRTAGGWVPNRTGERENS